MNELPRVLFSNVALMELVGFNARQVEEGLPKRGDAQRQTKQKQGPLSAQSLADNISTIVIDRGYLDGEDVWQVDQWGILFVVVGKANMTVTQDAQALAKRERTHVRERMVSRGRGKTARKERLRTELVGIEGLTTYDDYGDPQQTRVMRSGATIKGSPSTRWWCEASTIGCLPPMAPST